MADPKYPDSDLGTKLEVELPADAPDMQLAVYRGNGPPRPKPKKPKPMPARSPEAEAMRRRMAMKDD